MDEKSYQAKILAEAERLSFDIQAVYLDVLGVVQEALLGERRLPDTLFHYTNTTGLLGLLRTHSFWATHFEYLNDPQEVGLFSRVARELIAAELEKDPNAGNHHLISDSPATFRTNFLSILHSARSLTRHYAPYVLSLSEKGDLLGQWRAYGDDGHGYCLEFDVERIREVISDTQWPCFVWPIVYDDKMHSELARKAIDLLIEKAAPGFLETKSGYVKNEIFRKTLECAHRVFALIGPTQKHSGFTEEAEWRIVIDGVHPEVILGDIRQNSLPNSENALRAIDHHIDYNIRARGRSLLPYVSIPFSSSDKRKISLVSVTCGPSHSAIGNNSALRLLLKKEGYDDGIGVKTSKIPYRAP